MLMSDHVEEIQKRLQTIPSVPAASQTTVTISGAPWKSSGAVVRVLWPTHVGHTRGTFNLTVLAEDTSDWQVRGRCNCSGASVGAEVSLEQSATQAHAKDPPQRTLKAFLVLPAIRDPPDNASPPAPALSKDAFQHDELARCPWISERPLK